MLSKQADHAYWALRVTYGLVPIVAGLDKFTNLPAHLRGSVFRRDLTGWFLRRSA